MAEEKKQESLFDFLKGLEKRVDGMQVGRVSDLSKVERPILTSPSYDLNRILSGSLFGGIGEGTFTLLVGPETSGKTTLMSIFLANAARMGYEPWFIDMEGHIWKDAKFVVRWGLEESNVTMYENVEALNVVLANVLNSKRKRLAIAVDSIGALKSAKIINDGLKGDIKDDQGKTQQRIKTTLKLLVNICKSLDSFVFAAGHFYGNPSGYGLAEQIGGGKYAKLAPDIIISLKKEQIKESQSGPVIGTKIKASTLKNRENPPFQEAEIDIDYRKGVNRYAGLMKLALDLGLVEIGGPWYTLPDGTKCQGEKRAIEHIEKNPKPFLDAIDKQIKKEGYSSVNYDLENEVLANESDPVVEDKDMPKITRTTKKSTKKKK